MKGAIILKALLIWSESPRDRVWRILPTNCLVLTVFHSSWQWRKFLNCIEYFRYRIGYKNVCTVFIKYERQTIWEIKRKEWQSSLKLWVTRTQSSRMCTTRLPTIHSQPSDVSKAGEGLYSEVLEFEQVSQSRPPGVKQNARQTPVKALPSNRLVGRRAQLEYWTWIRKIADVEYPNTTPDYEQ